MQQLDRELMETQIQGLLNVARSTGGTPSKVILGSDIPMREIMSVEGVPCVVSQSQPANQIRIVNRINGHEEERLVVNCEKQPLIPDWLTERLKDAGLL